MSSARFPAGVIRKSAVDPLARAIGDRDIAVSVVLERLVLQQEVELDARAVLAAELAFVDDHFRGSVPAYLAALRRIQLTRVAARGLLLDELRRDAVRARFLARRPSGAEIADFHGTYAGLRPGSSRPCGPSTGWAARRAGSRSRPSRPTRIFNLRARGACARCTA